MRQSSVIFVGSVLWAVLGLAQAGTAQSGPSPTIHRVTVRADAGVLTITGTGLGPDLLVTVDGLPVTTLPGAGDTQLEVLAPASLLTTPGSYRLTVVDPVRQVGDGFVVASPLRDSVAASVGTFDRSRVGAAASPSGSRPVAPVTRVAGDLNAAEVSPHLVEGPTNTAVGVNALAANTTGEYNTASGSRSLRNNTIGTDNTASGADALGFNTSGTANTASGSLALQLNGTGSYNTASGFMALRNNTSGHDNTASGYQALYSNSTGFYNTASGYKALAANTTGDRNTATGAAALVANTTGYYNTATGLGALYSNTTGGNNTASGSEALFANATGHNNTASGYFALHSNTTGSGNTSSGWQSMYDNTTGSLNTATGSDALASNTTGSFNTAIGTNALYRSTGNYNVGLGRGAGFLADTGSYNLFLGANVQGTVADTNTIRIGLPYDGFVGQTRTFIAAIHGTQLTGPAVQVFVDANGQLGTITAPIASGTGTTPPSQALQQQVQHQQATIEDMRRLLTEEQEQSRAQQATNADLRAELARLEALMKTALGRR